MGEARKAVSEFGCGSPVAGKAVALRADAREGCGFCEGVTICERANAACGLTHGVPPICEFGPNQKTAVGMVEWNYA
jgi:hypothetical protein